ncbi:uncharacterized protein EV422DRAFT_504106 [Fimicolochytrium jonesii]|uniref:uncharacterized protein n=1 Tax=Fimicolochytrium jonesii TaxID=1396493 RepID=UPI0022FE695D|nr:uncharacterized protein EV422DRAFT_504106 [Fimicolochytrium jonesii]KAI8824036.1 hypothetical protein EV422DRAFT_504106 [Fimicolochytrium jonesii]
MEPAAAIITKLAESICGLEAYAQVPGSVSKGTECRGNDVDLHLYTAKPTTPEQRECQSHEGTSDLQPIVHSIRRRKPVAGGHLASVPVHAPGPAAAPRVLLALTRQQINEIYERGHYAEAAADRGLEKSSTIDIQKLRADAQSELQKQGSPPKCKPETLKCWSRVLYKTAVHVVEAAGSGDFAAPSDALQCCRQLPPENPDGWSIIIRPEVYERHAALEEQFPIQLLGGSMGSVSDASARMTELQSPPANASFVSHESPCVTLYGSGTKGIQDCMFRRLASAGVLLDEGAAVTMERCDLREWFKVGVKARGQDTSARHHRCNIRDCKRQAVVFGGESKQLEMETPPLSSAMLFDRRKWTDDDNARQRDLQQSRLVNLFADPTVATKIAMTGERELPCSTKLSLSFLTRIYFEIERKERGDV